MVMQVSNPLGENQEKVETVDTAAASDKQFNDMNKDEKISWLSNQLERERTHSRTLAAQLEQVKKTLIRQNVETEAEEESITNKLCKQLSILKKEKEKLAVDAEREEEFLTNSLQKKLYALRQEKVSLENQLEQEQEFATNRLQKYLTKLEKDKLATEQRLEHELSSTIAKLESYLDLVSNCCKEGEEMKVDDTGISSLKSACLELQERFEKDIQEKQSQQNARSGEASSELQRLRDENFLLRQKVLSEYEKRAAIESEKVCAY